MLDLDPLAVHPDKVERGGPTTTSPDRVRSGRTHRHPTTDLSRPLRVIVPTEHDVRAQGKQHCLRGARTGEAPPLRYDTWEHIVVEHRKPHLVRRHPREDFTHPRDLGRRQVSLDRQIVQIERHRAEGESVCRTHPCYHDVVQLQGRSDVSAKIGSPFLVQHPLAQDSERSSPPLHVVIAGHQVYRRHSTETRDKPLRGLEFTMPGPLCQVARHDDDLRPKAGKEAFQHSELRQVRAPAEVDIGDVGDDDVAHQVTRTRYVNVALPPAGTGTLNRVFVEESFSALRLEDTTTHSPPRCSMTSTVAAELPALVRVTR